MSSSHHPPAQLAPAKPRQRKRKREFEDWLKHTDNCPPSTRRMIGCKAHLGIIASFLPHKEVLRMQGVCKEFQRFIRSHHECFGSTQLPWVKLSTKLAMQKFGRHPLSKHFGMHWMGARNQAYALHSTRALHTSIESLYTLPHTLEKLYIEFTAKMSHIASVWQLPRLQVLHLQVASENASIVLPAASAPATLRELVLDSAANLGEITLNAELQHLYVFRGRVPTLTHLHGLQTLHLSTQYSNSTHVPSSVVELDVANAWKGLSWPPGLKTLRWKMHHGRDSDIGEETDLSDQDLQTLVDTLPNTLQELVLRECPMLPLRLPSALVHLTLLLTDSASRPSSETYKQFCFPLQLRSLILGIEYMDHDFQMPPKVEATLLYAEGKGGYGPWIMPPSCQLFVRNTGFGRKMSIKGAFDEFIDFYDRAPGLYGGWTDWMAYRRSSCARNVLFKSPFDDFQSSLFVDHKAALCARLKHARF